jgi:hypothetical protein
VNTSVTKARVYEFDFPTLGTLLRVEESDGAVVVRATRDTFTDERKSRFIRELVAEGFIPDGCVWSPLNSPIAFRGVQWLVDLSSQPKRDSDSVARAHRYVTGLLSGGLLIWLALSTLGALYARFFEVIR